MTTPTNTPQTKTSKRIITVTKTTPFHHKFEQPLRVDLVLYNDEFQTHDNAFLEIRGVTISVKEINPDMVIQALGNSASSFTFRWNDEFPNSIAKDLYKQARDMFWKMQCDETMDGDGFKEEEEEEMKARETRAQECNVLFDMVVIDRPHHTMVIVERDGFDY